MVSTFFRKRFLFQILHTSHTSYLFSSCGGVHKSGDENLVKLYDTNLKLASIMPFWVYHWKINLYDKIRHQILIKMVKLSKKYF